jgi:rod shape-determining protein MreD
VNPQLLAGIRIGLLVALAIVIQTAVGSDLRVAGVAPDLMVLLAICAGLIGGAEAGAWVGFWAGLVADLFLTGTPLGLSALTYCLIGAGVGALRTGMLPEARLVVPATAFFATAAAVVLWVGLGDVLGQTQLLDSGRSWLIKVALVEAGWAAVLAVPATWLYARAARGSKGADRVGSIRGGSTRPARRGGLQVR